jgi:hypothetical protein
VTEHQSRLPQIGQGSVALTRFHSLVIAHLHSEGMPMTVFPHNRVDFQ